MTKREIEKMAKQIAASWIHSNIGTGETARSVEELLPEGTKLADAHKIIVGVEQALGRIQERLSR